MNILQNKYFHFSALVLFIYIFPYLILGDNCYVRIHDNLDSMHVWFKVLAESGKIFSDNYETIPIFMNAPRVALENELNIQLWLYYFFEPYTALVINQILIRVGAFIGMYIYLNKYIFNNKNNEYSILIALLYSLLPFWSPAGLTVAGIPFVVYAFLNIRSNKSSYLEWIILLIYQLYSVFYHGGFFIVIFAGILWIYDIYTKKNIKMFTISLFYFGIIGLLINYRILSSFFIDVEYISHRVEQVASYKTFLEAMYSSFKHFLNGQTHTESLHIIFLPFIIFIFILNIISNNKDKLLIVLFLLNVFISLFYGFWGYEGWKILKESYQLLIPLNLGRLYNVAPFIWYALFAISIKYYLKNYNVLDVIIDKFPGIKKINYYNKLKYKPKNKINLLIIINIIILFLWSDFTQGFSRSFLKYPTYKEFYSKELFTEIKNFINKDQSDYKVAALGLFPSVLNYNGFHTLGGYSSNYPLKYKHQFRKIIEKELSKNENIRKYFDNWGNRCYLFVAGVGTFSYHKKRLSIDLNINSTALYNMGGRYILSTYKIKNPEINSLNLIKKFDKQSSALIIYLYGVKQK